MNGYGRITQFVRGLTFVTASTLMISSSFAGTVYDIPAAVNLYLSPSGRAPLTRDIQNILQDNNFNINTITKSGVTHETGIKTVDELIPDNPELTYLIKRSKRYFTEFFEIRNHRLGRTHNFLAQVDNIRLRTDFRRIGVNFYKDSHEQMRRNGVRFELELELSDFMLTVRKATIEDLQHSFFKQVGVENVEFGMTNRSVPLRFKLPITAKVQSGSLKVSVGQPTTNITEIDLDIDYSNLILPSVRMQVGNRSWTVDLKEIRQLLKSKHSKLLTGLQEKAQEFVDTELAGKLDKIIEEN